MSPSAPCVSLQSAPSREAVPIVAPLIREQEEDVGLAAGVRGYECQRGHCEEKRRHAKAEAKSQISNLENSVRI